MAEERVAAAGQTGEGDGAGGGLGDGAGEHVGRSAAEANRVEFLKRMGDFATLLSDKDYCLAI